MLVVTKKTCRMQIGCTIPLKTVMFYMEQCPFEQQTVLAQVHELYNKKTKQKKKREAQ